MPPSVLPPKANARAAAEIDAEAERLFVNIDTNENGIIDANELLKHLLEAGVDTDEITRTFAAIDTDGDGKITKEEWRAGYARYLAADETLDPTKDLKAPHFRHMRRVAALVLGPAGDATTAAADIRLLSARKLVMHIDGGGKMQIRQVLEAAGTDVFLDAATVRGSKEPPVWQVNARLSVERITEGGWVGKRGSVEWGGRTSGR